MRHLRFASVVVIVVSLGVTPQAMAAGSGGRPQWAALLAEGDFPSRLAVSPSGDRVYVTGDAPGAEGNSDFLTVAYSSADGSMVWKRRLVASKLGADSPSAIALSPDGGRVFVTGSTRPNYEGDLADFVTVAYDAGTGAPLWQARFDASNFDDPCCLSVSPDGLDVYVSGMSGQGGDANIATLAYESATGSEEWRSIYDSGGSEDPQAMALSPDRSSLYVTGAGTPPGLATSNVITLSVDAGSGTLQWVSLIPGPEGASYGVSIGMSPDGSRVYVLSDMPTPVGRLDYGTLALDASTGAQIWTSLYDSSVHGLDIPSRLAVDPAGDFVFVTGTSDQGHSTDFVTISYAASTGEQRWLSDFDDPRSGPDNACCLAVDPDGSRLTVGGWSVEGGEEQYVMHYTTVGYDAATGAQLWWAKFHAKGGYALLQDLAVSRVGHLVFETGAVVGDDYEWGTVAYQA
jgi:DNA-binding beta-propeller fold protein YncE